MHEETHSVTRISWLRAAILGANDGIVSTASLIAGVSAAGASEASILIAGSAGLVAGAMSMAAGEYVSVSSQGDAEKADVELEKRHLAADGEYTECRNDCVAPRWGNDRHRWFDNGKYQQIGHGHSVPDVHPDSGLSLQDRQRP